LAIFIFVSLKSRKLIFIFITLTEFFFLSETVNHAKQR